MIAEFGKFKTKFGEQNEFLKIQETIGALQHKISFPYIEKLASAKGEEPSKNQPQLTLSPK